MLLIVQCSFDKCRFLPTCTCLNLIFYLPCQWSSFFESAAERLLYCCLVTKYSLLMLLWHKALILPLIFPYFFNVLNKSHTHPLGLCMHLYPSVVTFKFFMCIIYLQSWLIWCSLSVAQRKLLQKSPGRSNPPALENKVTWC